MNKEQEPIITDLYLNGDKTFILGYTDNDGIERMYQVEICVNSHGELVRLKSIKRS